MSLHLHFVVVIGNCKFENWHLYHLQPTCSANGKVKWIEYKRIL